MQFEQYEITNKSMFSSIQHKIKRKKTIAGTQWPSITDSGQRILSNVAEITGFGNLLLAGENRCLETTITYISRGFMTLRELDTVILQLIQLQLIGS